MRSLGLAAIVIGLLLVALSFVWVTMFPAEKRWSNEQAREHAQNVARYHQLQHTVGGHSHGKAPSTKKSAPKPTKAELDAARLRWEESDAALRNAQTADGRMAWWIRGIGVVVAALGIATVAFNKKKKPKRGSPVEFG
jgi:hypothetical protein